MLKNKITIVRTMTLTTELEVTAPTAEVLEAKSKAMAVAINQRGIKALPPVNWELVDSSIRVTTTEAA